MFCPSLKSTTNICYFLFHNDKIKLKIKTFQHILFSTFTTFNVRSNPVFGR